MPQIYVHPESDTNKATYGILAHQDADGEYKISGSANPAPVIEEAHLRLHEGKSYYSYKFHPNSSKLNAGASIDIAIAFATGIKPHLSVDTNCGGDAEFYLYEGATVTGGTTFTAISRNRNIAHPSQSATLINPTISATGTLLDSQFLAGGFGKKAGGAVGGSFEFVLAPLTTYLFRLTNVNGTAHMAHLMLEWYE